MTLTYDWTAVLIPICSTMGKQELEIDILLRIAAEYRRTHKDCQSAEQFQGPGTYIDIRCATCKAYDALTQKEQP